MNDQNRHRPAPTSNNYISERLRLHYLEWGVNRDVGRTSQDADAPAILLVHGVQDHARTWDALVAGLGGDYRFIAPDLRGHGDSDWLIGAGYHKLDYLYDLAQLMRQRRPEPGPVIAHSMGGTLAALYAGVFPEQVDRLVLIEGVGLHPSDYDTMGPAERVRTWIRSQHDLAARQPKRYPSLEAALERMQRANPHLSPEQARHLTVCGTHQNEDSSYSWKFDNYTHSWPPYGMPDDDVVQIWRNIACPVLIINGTQGFSHRIGQNGTDKHFQDLRMINVDGAGHWVQHDQLDRVVTEVTEFLTR